MNMLITHIVKSTLYILMSLSYLENPYYLARL